MPQRDSASLMTVKTSIEPQTVGAPLNGAAVDVTDGDAQTIIVKFGGTVDATAVFKIQEDDGAGGWTDLVPAQTPGPDVVLYGQDYPVAAAIADDSTYRYAYVGKRGTVRTVLSPNAGNTIISSTVIGNRLYEQPNLSGYTEA